MLGRWPLIPNIWDMKYSVDYLKGRPEVEPNRIGMMGLSKGGTVTTFTVGLRLAAAHLMSYVNSWKVFAFDRRNFCGSQIVRGRC